MGNMILRSDVIYLQPWQIAAGRNTQIGLWPPVPIQTERPYLASVYLPIEQTGGLKLEDVGGPPLMSDVVAVEGGPGGLSHFMFTVMRKELVTITEIADSEAILMGLVSISGYQRRKAKALIKEAWDRMVTAPALKYAADPAPLALFLGLKRVA